MRHWDGVGIGVDGDGIGSGSGFGKERGTRMMRVLETAVEWKLAWASMKTVGPRWNEALGWRGYWRL